MNKLISRALMVLLVSLLTVTTFMTGASNAGPGSSRQYVTSAVGLELDGAFAGWLSSVEGGNIDTGVIQEPVGPDGITRKHIGGVKYENITLKCSTGMSDKFYNLIKDFFEMKKTTVKGTIVYYDFNLKETSRLSFTGEIIEVDFPALDAGSEDIGRITVVINPSMTRIEKASKEDKSNNSNNNKNKTSVNKWILANYRINISGLEGATDKVSRIDEVKIQRTKQYNEYSNLIITLPETDGVPLINWADEFIFKGNSGQNQEKTGTIEILDQTRNKVLFTLTFRNLGIYTIYFSSLEQGDDSIRSMQAGMYCEKIDINFNDIK